MGGHLDLGALGDGARHGDAQLEALLGLAADLLAGVVRPRREEGELLAHHALTRLLRHLVRARVRVRARVWVRVTVRLRVTVTV